MKKLLTAVALATAAYAASAVTLVQSVSTGPLSNTVSSTGTVANHAATKSLSFNQFDSDLGVLTGVTSGLSITAGTLQLSAAGTRSSQSTNSRGSFASTGSAAASSDLTGLSTFGAINNTLSNTCTDCPPKGATNSNLSSSFYGLTQTDSTWLSPTATVATPSMSSYVGTGTIASTLSLTNTVAVTDKTNLTGATATLAFSTAVNATQSLTYSYLKHANASFTSFLDTNDLTIHVGVDSLDFSIFNLGSAADTTKLDYMHITCISGDCTNFNLNSFTMAGDLVAGTHFDSSIVENGYNPHVHHAATYELVFSDDTVVGALNSLRQNTLSFTVEGAPVQAVPEPETYVLMLAGLSAIGFVAKRRQLVR